MRAFNRIIKSFSIVSLFLLLNGTVYSQTPGFGSVLQVGGTSLTYSLALDVDATGNVYSTGFFGGTADFDPGPGILNYTSGSTQNIFVVKINPSGSLLWAAHFIGTGLSAGVGIEVNSAGATIITGYFAGTVDFDPGLGVSNLTSFGSTDIFVCKLDTSGGLVWVKQMGGPGIQQPSSIALDAADNIYTTGVLYSTADFDPGPGVFNMTSVNADDIFVSKLDTDGNFVYAKRMGGTSINKGGKSIDVDASGNVIFTGRFQGTVDFDPGPGVFNLVRPVGGLIAPSFICKLDPSGDLVWAKIWQGETRNERKALITDASGNIFIAGYFGFAADIDPGPGVLNLTPGGNNDMLVMKLDANGDLIWVKQMVGATGTTSSWAEAIDLDQFGNIYTTGLLFGTVDFDPGVGTATLTSSGSTFEDFFISKLDPSGNFAWAGKMGGLNADNGLGIAVDVFQNVYTTGTFSGTCDFDPSSCVVELSPFVIGRTDSFIFKAIQTIQLQPTISGFAPTNGPIGSPVIISGSDFDPIPSNNIVRFNGVNAVVTASNSTSITTSVPSGATSGLVSVTIGCITAVSSGNFIVGGVPIPTISTLTPSSGSIGTTVTITGTNFSTTLANNIVYFGATKAAVTGATATQLTVVVPAGATYQPISVSVSGLTAHAPKPFVVTFSGGGNMDACSFAPSTTIASVPNFDRAAFADVDDDGKPDLLIPNYTSSNFLSIFRNISTVGSITPGSFAPKIDFPTGTAPVSVAVGDLDSDGKRDIAVVNYSSGTLSVYKNQSTPGTVSLAAKVDFAIPTFAHDIYIADVDGDGKQDLIITTSLVGLTVLRNTGTFGIINASTFAAGVNFTTGPNPFPFAVGDIDGDGKIDAAVPNANAYSVSLLRNTSTPGTISFASQTLTITAGTPPVGLGTATTVLGDIDGDAKLDLVVTTNTVNTVSLFRNTSTAGAITFDPKFDIALPATSFLPAISDLDGDGKIDLVTDHGATSLGIYKNTAVPGVINAGSFAAPIIAARSPSGINQIGDVDGDGRNDIISTSTNTQVFRNLVGTISPPTILSFSPTVGPVGTTVTINGSNFSTPFLNSITFNGTPATLTSSNTTTLTTTVPTGATTGPIEITIGCNTTTTSNFTVGTPIILITAQPSNASACVGDVATFTTAATGTTNISYQWQFSPDGIVPFTDLVNGGGYSNVNTSILSVNTTGTFGEGRYRCRINGDLAAEVITFDEGLVINSIPGAPSVTNNSSCGPGALTLSASGGSNGDYRWYDVAIGGSAIVGEASNTYLTPVLASTTTYYVSLNNGTCESPRTAVSATINIPPAKPVIISNIPPTGANITVCSSNLLTLTAPTGFTSYLWSNGETTEQITVSSSANYSVVVINSDGCDSPSSDALMVIVIPTPCSNQAPVINSTLATVQIAGVVSIDLSLLISDADDNIDISTLIVIVQPSSGALTTIVNGILTINYSGLTFSGQDKLTIEICDLLGSCTQQEIIVDVTGDLVVFTGISPNGDAFNEKWIIQNIESLPDTKENNVSIFNRWGDPIFEIENYNNNTRVFKGINKNGNEVTSGVYFYRIIFKSGRESLTGYLTINK